MKNLALINLAGRNLKRRLSRTAAVMIAVLAATFTLFTTSALLLGLEKGMRRGRESLGADLYVFPMGEGIDPWIALTGEAQTGIDRLLDNSSLMDEGLQAEIAGVKGVKAVTPQLYLSTWKDPNSDHCSITDAPVIAYDPGTDFLLRPLLKNKVKWPPEKDEIIAGNNMMPYLEDGERVYPWLVYGQKFAVVGTLRKTGTALDFALFIPEEGVRFVVEEALGGSLLSQDVAESIGRLKPGLVSAFLVKTEPTIKPDELAWKVKSVLPPSVLVAPTANLLSSVGHELYASLRNLVLLGVAFWGMSALVVGVIFSTNVSERRREIGLLRAMGAPARSIFKLVMYESGILTGLAGLGGVTLGAAFLAYFGALMRARELSFTGPSPQSVLFIVLVCLGAGIASGALGALFPAVRCSRMEPLDAIRTGG